MIDPTQVFECERSRLLSIGYRMLGSLSAAEDLVQDCWLRWQAQDHGSIRTPAAWLTTAMTRLSIDRLRAEKTVRERYIGPWLPEPLVSDGQSPVDRVALAEGLTMALLVVMEALSPAERAAFILREAFDYDYADIAGVLQTTQANARKLVSRARAHVDDGAPREKPAPDIAIRLAAAFQKASADGDLTPLEALLHEDVLLRSDGGGKVMAALNPITGRQNVIRFLLGLERKSQGALDYRLAFVSGGPGFVITAGTDTFAVVSLATRDGRLSNIDLVRNPEKLGG
ncbi:RNA polymerase sigma factor SigJ [Minwuia sp.]|uniref:RNA polymerase sigma factor SigJ n=1 Tax=Minwuia sp. TaxID=2493630 RepID=UPI003A8FE88C